LERDLAVEQIPEKRMDIMTAFINTLIIESASAIKYDSNGNFSMGTVEGYKILMALNKLLPAVSYYMKSLYYPDTKNFSLNLFEVEGTQTAKIKSDDTEKEIPVVYVKSPKEYFTHTAEKRDRLNGVYEPVPDLIVLNRVRTKAEFEIMAKRYIEKCGEGAVKPQELPFNAPQDWENAFIYHEGMHGAFGLHLKKMGQEFFPLNQTLIKRKDDVQMNGYIYPARIFRLYNDGHIAELTGHGYGLQHSGTAARIVAHSILDGGGSESQYKMASEVFIQELMHSPDLSEGMRSELIGYKVDAPAGRVIAAVNELSDESLHKIGERMVKLGYYLTQE